MPREIDRFRVNDVLTALAAEFGVELDDDTLNDLTHTVADALAKLDSDYYTERNADPETDES